jgi:hypothetical protein
MSIIKSTTSSNKFKPFSLGNFTYRSGHFVVWPKKKSYNAWQNLLKTTLGNLKRKDVSYPCRKQKKKNKYSHRYRKFLHAKARCKDEIADRHIGTIVDQLEAFKCSQAQIKDKGNDVQLPLITMLKHFWDRKHMSEHIENTTADHRNQDLVTYSKQSIMMAAISIFLFRMGSGNKYDEKSHDEEEDYSMANIAKFIDAPEERVPVIKTIETFLKNLDEQSINNLMISFFKDLQHSKFFREHSQIMPGDFFLLAADCVHTHTYEHPHHKDIDGNNDCACCLKRVYNKGTENEKVKWMHNTLVFSFVFFGGLKIPIYNYPIHAKQIVNFENASETQYKQECELVAIKVSLPYIRKAFPRMKIVLLLDGLYANKPVIKLAEEQKCGYIIVRKDSCLSLLAKECDEHAATSNHKKNCVKKCQKIHKGWTIDQRYEWFNSSYLGENISTNVLRFWEARTKEGLKTETYKCEWLFSWKISANNCELAAYQARSRWEIEDLFQSLKRRGFNFKHDFSRNPHSFFNWHSVSLLAFGIFELFRFSEAVRQRGDWQQNTLADKLLAQLLQRPTEHIFSHGFLLKRVQFRYHFVVKQILTRELNQDSTLDILQTG